jgi:hypothetical protein
MTFSIVGFSRYSIGEVQIPRGEYGLVQGMIAFDGPSQDIRLCGCPVTGSLKIQWAKLSINFFKVAELLIRFAKVWHLLKFQDEYLKSNGLPSWDNDNSSHHHPILQSHFHKLDRPSLPISYQRHALRPAHRQPFSAAMHSLGIGLCYAKPNSSRIHEL